MVRILKDLKDDHAVVIGFIKNISEGSKSDDYRKEVLIKLKAMIEFHFNKEETDFYPELKRISRTGKKTKKTPDIFKKSIELIKKTGNSFFYRYIDGDDFRNFESDFLKYSALVIKAFEYEETVIYKITEGFFQSI